jgi:hypothetical protein
MSQLKPVILFILFVAAFLIITGVYEQKLEAAENKKKIEYRFIPRTFYEEQLGKTNTITDKIGSMFESESPWYDRTVGLLSDVKIPKPL